MTKRSFDFPLKVVRALADRVAYRCSYPNCPSVTLGPSDEHSTATSRTGMACHIYSGTPKGSARRYDSSLKNDVLRDISNGIWMCATHGKIIDTDEDRFTADHLRLWRSIAELRARYQQDGIQINPEDFSQAVFNKFNFPKQNIILDNGSDYTTIGNAIEDSCLINFWGNDVADSVRDFIIEISRNAFQHGMATTFKIDIQDHSICLTDDGQEFDLWKLEKVETISGGRKSLRHLKEKLRSNIAIFTNRQNSLNSITIASLKSIDELPKFTPCLLQLTSEHIRRSVPIQLHDACETIYITLPDYFPFSDLYMLQKKLCEIEYHKKNLIFVLNKTSSAVEREIQNSFPKSTFIKF